MVYSELNMVPNIPKIKKFKNNSFFLIAGPCVIEGREMVFDIAEKILKTTQKLEIPFIFKSSYKKANRSKADSFTGIGDKEALSILKEVGNKFSIPILTDVHSPEEAVLAAQSIEVLQIPAFLSRQTELITSCAKTGKWINIKKGQFSSPESMRFAVEKVQQLGNNNILLTERGTTFGYEDLVVDYRSIPTMQKNGVPVVLDVTHSLQRPNQSSGVTGGRPDLIPILARAGIAAGADGIFLETHPDPKEALSDGANMLPLRELENLLESLVKIHEAL